MPSVFDLFTIGIGPSSSHTVGPMRAAGLLVDALAGGDPMDLGEVRELRVELLGSLGATGPGHCCEQAVMLGLMGARPETVDPAVVPVTMAELAATGRLVLLGGSPMRQHVLEGFDLEDAVSLRPNKRLSYHPNALRFHLRGD